MYTFDSVKQAFRSYVTGILHDDSGDLSTVKVDIELSNTTYTHTVSETFTIDKDKDTLHTMPEVIANVINTIVNYSGPYCWQLKLTLVSTARVNVHLEVLETVLGFGCNHNVKSDTHVCLDLQGNSITPNLTTKMVGGFIVHQCNPDDEPLVYDVLIYDTTTPKEDVD